MKTTKMVILIGLMLTLIGCTVQPAILDPDVTPIPSPTLPDPRVHVTQAPDIEASINRFMNAWQDEDYEAMYSMLTMDARRSIDQEAFRLRYLNTAIALTLAFEDGIVYQVISKLTNPNDAMATIQVNYNTHLFGTISRDLSFSLSREAGEWRVDWDEAMIFPELEGGHSLEVVRQTTPRGNIYANNGIPIVAEEEAVAIGFIPANLNPDLMSLFYTTMARLSIYQADEIVRIVENALPNNYVPLGEATRAQVEANMGAISSLSGVFLNYYTSRYYYNGGIAPQAVGHLSYISEEELNRYLRMGYSANERFGSTGLERAFESELSGERGASLYLKDSNGQIVTKLAERNASPGQSITTTIDAALQSRLQRSLGNFRGAIVVMEIDTGRILAMVSNPQFDPNLFDINNQNFIHAPNPYVQPNDPVFNRATNGQYPLGSVFKIISMAAALETELFDANSELFCGHTIQVCGNELRDWTLERELPPSGNLTLSGGLMRSCNPWFFYIGEQLLFEGQANAIPEMARAFGLGQITGVEIPEEPGNIPAQINSCEQNVQLAIGQGEMTVTPLQVASFTAAVGNGGTLYRPTLVEQITTRDGTPTFSFATEVVGTLPISDEHLTIIQDAMRDVITNPRGTARSLNTMRYRSFGKTGTAENPFGISHAWFAGYTQVGDPNRPDIAVAVIVENAGEGSEMAVPVFRRAVSLYFSNYVDTGQTLRWEAYPYVVASPTPIPTDTPIPTIPPPPTPTPDEWEQEEEEPPVEEPVEEPVEVPEE